MNTSNVIINVLRNEVFQLPIILACLAGCICVLVRWRFLRGAALPALLGFGLGLMVTMVFPVIWAFLPTVMPDGPGSPPWVMMSWIVQSLGWAAALVLLLLGVLRGRNQVPPGAP